VDWDPACGVVEDLEDDFIGERGLGGVSDGKALVDGEV
jgi:hypothetical protein